MTRSRPGRGAPDPGPVAGRTAGDRDGADRIARGGLSLSLVVAVPVAIVLMAFAVPLADVFVKESEALSAAAGWVSVYAAAVLLRPLDGVLLDPLVRTAMLYRRFRSGEWQVDLEPGPAARATAPAGGRLTRTLPLAGVRAVRIVDGVPSHRHWERGDRPWT